MDRSRRVCVSEDEEQRVENGDPDCVSGDVLSGGVGAFEVVYLKRERRCRRSGLERGCWRRVGTQGLIMRGMFVVEVCGFLGRGGEVGSWAMQCNRVGLAVNVGFEGVRLQS